MRYMIKYTILAPSVLSGIRGKGFINTFPDRR